MEADERFDKAYAIDYRVYYGEDVTQSEREFVIEVAKEILESDTATIGYKLWAVFASKAV